MTTNSLLYFRFRWVNKINRYVEENYMTIFSSFSANLPPHYHTILAINCVHASNNCNQHNNWMSKWQFCIYCAIVLENNAQVMDLSDLLSDQLSSFCGDFNTDDDVECVRHPDPAPIWPRPYRYNSCGNDGYCIYVVVSIEISAKR